MLQQLEVDVGAGISDSSPLHPSPTHTLPTLRVSITCATFVPEVGYVLGDACGALWVVQPMTLAVLSHRCMRVCACACVCACVRACVCVRACACVRACVALL